MRGLLRSIPALSDSRVTVYGDYEALETTLSFAPLDPISVAGVFDIRRLGGRPWLDAAVRTVTDPTYFRHSVLDATKIASLGDLPLVRSTDGRYAAHFRDLERWNVFARFHDPPVLPMAVCRYFAVAKGEGTSARSIYDGRPLSRCCHKPPAFYLPDVSDVMRHLAQRNGFKTSIAVLDFRHYFHQILLDPAISRFFLLKIGQTLYRSRTLPMGWAYSPWIAQSCSFGVLLEAMADSGIEVQEVLSHDITPPHYLTLTQAGATAKVFVTYDNVIVFGDRQVVEEGVKHLARVCHSSPIIKEGSLKVADDQLLLGDENHAYPTHLGLQIRRRGRFEVRTSDATLARWIKVESRLRMRRRWTWRETLRGIGIVVHYTRARLQPLLAVAPVLNILRKLPRPPPGQTVRWDGIADIEEADRQTILTEVQKILANPWTALPQERAPEEAVHAFCDASDDRGGCVVLNRELQWEGHEFSLEKKITIYIKEFIAARKAIQLTLHARQNRPTKIILFCDNMAVIYGIRNRYSASLEAQEILRKIFAMLDQSKSSIEVRYIPTDDNPADEPSRARPVILAKIHAALREIHEETDGVESFASDSEPDDV